jgi:hypothetical protein
MIVRLVDVAEAAQAAARPRQLVGDHVVRCIEKKYSEMRVKTKSYIGDHI